MILRVEKEDIIEYREIETILELREKFDKIDPEICKNLDKLSKNIHFYICGGALRALKMGEDINDIDIYLENIADLDKIIDFFKNEEFYIIKRKHGILAHKGDVRFDIIASFYGNISEILAEFDFTTCMRGVDWKSGTYYEYKQMPKELGGYLLGFNFNTKYPISSLKRLKKYQKKGYYLNQINLMTILLKIRELNLCNEDVVEDQLSFYQGQNTTPKEKLDEIINLINEVEGNKIYGLTYE